MEIPNDQRRDKAKKIAEWFASEAAYDRFRTHGRPLRYPELKDVGLRVSLLEDKDKQDLQDLQDAVLSVFHASEITFGGSTIKILENHLGRRKAVVQQNILIGPQVPTPPTQSPVPGNRKERRAAEKNRR